jgi:glycosyltransferase involved in cell wall biosynthesis
LPDNIKGRVLFVGQCYYNTWYLSRALRKLGWKADVLNYDPNEDSQIYYHGEDFKFSYNGWKDKFKHLKFFINSIKQYDIFHFSNAHSLKFLYDFDDYIKDILPERWDIKLLKKLGKKIVYSNNSCLDGVSQSSFRSWAPEPVCDICQWRNNPDVCSDERNLSWGKLRNSLADYQITIGGNRKDYNDDPRVHEVPQFYCLDPAFWHPNLLVPTNYKLPFSNDTIKIFHCVGNYEMRTDKNQINIKCTHIYVPLIERLKKEGYNVELIFFHDVPNPKLRYYQVQADIVVDMLTFGFFGANAREAMMLGKPVICYLRPEWLRSMRKEVPEYVDEIPIISATPDNVYYLLKELIINPKKRREIGERSRAFAVKWHSADAAAIRCEQIYLSLLKG